MNQDEYLRAVEEERQASQLKETALFNFMTKEARERFRRVEMVHPDLASKALMNVLQGVQSGSVRMVNDNVLKSILERLNNNKEYNILRK